MFNLVTGADAEIGDYLVDHPRTRFINFTGSLTTGIRINERAAAVHPGQLWIKKVGLEMGGKDALIVDETADLDYAARMAVASGYGFGGQKCSAMSRLIAVDDIHDDLVDRFVALAARARGWSGRREPRLQRPHQRAGQGQEPPLHRHRQRDGPAAGRRRRPDPTAATT